nr:hypothetical protein [Tanacetum cinerariifolium]
MFLLHFLPTGCLNHPLKFLGTVKFGNDHVAKIMGYEDYQIGNVTISRVYYVEWHNYKHLDWISVRRDDDKIYKFKEGDFKRLRLQDIEDMLLLLVQGKLSNLTVEERFAFNVSLRMFTRSIVIQRRVGDLQLGVESYQKRLNLTKPDTYRSDLKRREAYTAYSNPRGFIYQNKDKKNRLMRIDELKKFSDGTLNDVRNAFDDRLKGNRMQYLPTTIWRKGDKDRAATMIQAIDKMLKTRRIMRSLERKVSLMLEILSRRFFLKLNLSDQRSILTDLQGTLKEKWNKKVERGIVVRNKARLVTQGHTQEEGINYKEVFAPVARIEAIILFLACASFMGFMVYQMDVKSAFLYGTIEEEVYVGQLSGFENPDHPDKVYKVVKALYGLHQAPRAWYETLANYLLENGFQRGKIYQTLFIKRQKRDILLVQIYVDDIIFGSKNKDLCKSFEKLMKDKFQMSLMRELTFFLDTEKPLLKDPDGEDVDVHTYRSMIGSLMYLTSLRPDIMFAQTVVATSSIKVEYVDAASCCAYAMDSESTAGL